MTTNGLWLKLSIAALFAASKWKIRKSCLVTPPKKWISKRFRKVLRPQEWGHIACNKSTDQYIYSWIPISFVKKTFKKKKALILSSRASRPQRFFHLRTNIRKTTCMCISRLKMQYRSILWTIWKRQKMLLDRLQMSILQRHQKFCWPGPAQQPRSSSPQSKLEILTPQPSSAVVWETCRHGSSDLASGKWDPKRPLKGWIYDNLRIFNV